MKSFVPRSLAALSGLVALLGACTTETPRSESSPAAASPTTEPEPSAAETPDASAPRPVDACGPVKASLCTPKNEGSVVRGIVKFDKSKLAPGSTPYLRVFLHHQMLLRDLEVAQGGHPHAYDSFKVDPEKGEVSFTLDLCSFGTAMWSEENCGFNLVVMIDDEGTNDPEKLGSTAMLPRNGKLVKMVPLEISCHKASPCLEITADCTDGEGCTRYTPPKTCACAAESCNSDDAFCKSR